ncbi:MAG TPA: universal stress protein [Casimicrobiaceae bacterium]|nr:universal stress protein [Casimicrobiaceae bacterium]
MTYRSILVPVDPTSESHARVDVAVRLARDFSAQLIGIYLDRRLEIAPSLAALLPQSVVEEYLHNAADAQHAAGESFRHTAAAGGVTDVDWRAPLGAPIDAVVAHGRCADLTVLSQPRTEPAEIFSEQLVQAVLLESGRPVLLVPYVGAPPQIGSNVLVAWDGGREAARAIADAMPLLVRARQVTVVCLDPGAAKRGVDAPARERLAAYLRRHGAATKIDSYELGGADVAIGDWLLSRAADLGGDLLVMGGYGHPRWREQALGGATQALLAAMTLPVLMAH